MSTTSSMSRSPTRPYLRTAPQSTSPNTNNLSDGSNSADKKLNQTTNYIELSNNNSSSSPHPTDTNSRAAAAAVGYVSPRHHASPDARRATAAGESEAVAVTPPRQIIPSTAPSNSLRRSEESSNEHALSPSTTATLLEDALAALAAERQRCEKLHQSLLTNSAMRRKLKEENAALKGQLAVLSNGAAANEAVPKPDNVKNSNPDPPANTTESPSSNPTETAPSPTAAAVPSTKTVTCTDSVFFPLSDLKTVVDEAMITERIKYEGLLQQYKQRVEELEGTIAKKDAENAKLRDRVEAFSPLRVKNFVNEDEGNEEQDEETMTSQSASPTRHHDAETTDLHGDIESSVDSKTRTFASDALPLVARDTKDGSPSSPEKGRAPSELFKRADDVVYRGAEFDGGERVPPPQPVSFVSLSNEEELQLQHQSASSTLPVEEQQQPQDNNKELLQNMDEDDLLDNTERLGPEALQHAVVYLFRRLRGAEIVLVEVQQESRGLRSERDKLVADVAALQRRLAVVSPRNPLLTNNSSAVAVAGRRGGPGFVSPSAYRSGVPTRTNSAVQSRTASRSPIRGPTTPTTTSSAAVTSRQSAKALAPQSTSTTSCTTTASAVITPSPQQVTAQQTHQTIVPPQQQQRSSLVYRTVSPLIKRQQNSNTGTTTAMAAPQQQHQQSTTQQLTQSTIAAKKSPFHLPVTATTLAGLAMEQSQQQSQQPSAGASRLQRDRSPLFRGVPR